MELSDAERFRLGMNVDEAELKRRAKERGDQEGALSRPLRRKGSGRKSDVFVVDDGTLPVDGVIISFIYSA